MGRTNTPTVTSQTVCIHFLRIIHAASNVYVALQVMSFFKLPINAALVLVDEVALDFGQLRLKGKGGPGGHNGLKSLQSHLKTPEYSRLRIGVGGGKCEGDNGHTRVFFFLRTLTFLSVG